MNDGTLTLGEEMMIAAIAREVRDEKIAAVGTLSPIPAAACLLASHTTAPGSIILILGDPMWPIDRGTSQLFDLAQRGLMDLFFLSGAQIDRRGNINLHVIGDYHRPKIRLPGGAGSAVLYYTAHRVILFKTSHTRRDFVQQVDFITSPGHTPQLSRSYRPGGPYKVITPLAVMAFNRKEGILELESVHPGVTVEQVLENTGFDLPMPDTVAETAPLSEEQRHVLKTTVRAEIQRVYPAFALRLGAPEKTMDSA
ncbi:MAG: CoA synthetase [Deltaproteobacteria bacterium]|nr:CoA synthetase [Deltaproteobacteria bacterium]MBW2306306.1 CoA synthetase [Deltaproteobacteria bacterium]